MELSELLSVNDLLTSLDEENAQITAKYAAKFEQLGRVFFRNKDVPGCWPVQEIIGEIEKMGNRQAAIARLQTDIHESAAKLNGKTLEHRP